MSNICDLLSKCHIFFNLIPLLQYWSFFIVVADVVKEIFSSVQFQFPYIFYIFELYS